MTKHIVILTAKSWGIGDSEAEAFARAKQQLDYRASFAERQQLTIEAPDGDWHAEETVVRPVGPYGLEPSSFDDIRP